MGSPREERALAFKRAPPVQKHKDINTASSPDIPSERFTQRWRLQTPSLSLSLPLSPSLSLCLCQSVAPCWSASNQWIRGASHNRGCRGSRAPGPPPPRTPTLGQHLPDRITKEYCFQSGIYVNCRGGYLSPFLSFVVFRQKFAYFRPKRVKDLHINRDGWWGL